MSCEGQFLSGEADPSFQSRQEQRLNDMLQNLSVSDETNSDGGALNADCDSKKSRPLIEIIDAKSSSDPAETDACCSVSGKAEANRKVTNISPEDGPPPLAFMDTVAEAADQNSSLWKPSEGVKEDIPEPPSLMEEMMAEAAKARSEKEKQLAKMERKSAKSSSFGFKKGFLTSSASSKSNSKPSEVKSKRRKPKKSTKNLRKGFLDEPPTLRSDGNHQEDEVFELDPDGNMVKVENETIPTISPKSQTSMPEKTDGFVLEEVQEAMKDGLNSPDLMDKIASNPRLVAGMANPKFTAALEMMQQNPRQAMSKFKRHPEIIDFLDEFCGVMGSHFMELGSKQDQEKTKAQEVDNISEREKLGPLAEQAVQRNAEKEAQGQVGWEQSMSTEERHQLDSVMADKELTELLMDSDLQRIIQQCGAPGRMQMFMQHPEYGPKLHKLIQAGLLSIEK